MNDSHSCTSMAVKAVVTEVKKRLVTRFSFLSGMPDFFYDFDKGLSDQFKQYYAKIPLEKRSHDWIVLSYSYDSSNRSSVQPRRGFSVRRPVAENLYRKLDANFVELPLLFSMLTNDSKLFNALNNFALQKLDWSFTIKFQDLLWPTWIANKEYPLGWYIRPSKPNGKLYMCTNPGLSGEQEPDWSLTDTTQDNIAIWHAMEPDLLDAKAGTFVKNDSVIQNPIENGIMYQYDFGYTLHYIDLEDNGEFVGLVTEAMLDIINWPGTPEFKETMIAR